MKIFNKQDQSVYITPEILEKEERLCFLGEHNRTMARLITESYDTEKGAIADMIECGCGTGWVTFYLFNTYKLRNIKYKGLDKNPLCIQRCIIKKPQIENPDLEFGVQDIRDFIKDAEQADMVFALNLLKHFSIIEWRDIFRGFMKAAKKYAIFSMNITKLNDADDGVEFPHLWINQSKLMKCINEDGFEMIEYVPFSYWALEGTWIDNKSSGIFVCKRILDTR